MPAYRSGESRTLIKSTGKWVKNKKERAFDYDKINKKSWALLISFFRFYPDFLLDLLRAKNAEYGLELVQRIMLRVQARYGLTYITGCRGLTKTFITVAGKMIDGVLFPRIKTRYYAPSQKQSAKLASQAYASIAQCYPILASCWTVNNDRAEMFYMTTSNNSEFAMYAPRGDNFHEVVGEEIAQEGEGGFDFDTFESDITKGHRLVRSVNGKEDRACIQLKQNYISNASSRTNKAFSVYRAAALEAMIKGDKYEGCCMDVSWKTALLCNLRSIAYYKKEKKTTSPEVWAKEMEVKYGGSSENPMIEDETLSKSRKLVCMEDCHCGDLNAIYIVSYDVADEDGAKNAKCGLSVVKLTEFTEKAKRDKYKAQVVYVDSFSPPKTAYGHAQKLKAIWRNYCMEGGQATYLVIDAQGGHGKPIIEELMKPTSDGSRPLACVDGYHSELEQKNALKVIYPMKAGTKGTTNPEGDMIEYAQLEFEQGNVELLMPRILDGIEQYKLKHNIKDNLADAQIAIPYKKTEELCGQIKNLQKIVSGTTTKEKRKSKSVQRDIWSSLKYALRIKWRLEQDLLLENNQKKNSWDAVKENCNIGYFNSSISQSIQNNSRARLIQLRRR